MQGGVEGDEDGTSGGLKRKVGRRMMNNRWWRPWWKWRLGKDELVVSRGEARVVNILVEEREDCGVGRGLRRKRSWSLRFYKGYWGNVDFWVEGNGSYEKVKGRKKCCGMKETGKSRKEKMEEVEAVKGDGQVIIKR